ncbi:hypothetical protein [Isoptericola sp. BMS4]|uniref:hypothetical protein n=1 Tax=Isoptericola sp. BMS4 TaxID=2527875 RepID=UPI00141F90B8|nr:hypothetical protein [Isoptericola sp. BMS4]
MSDDPNERARPDEEDAQPLSERERALRDGRAADVGAVPGEDPKDDPDEEGEDRFDAG